MGGTNCSRPLTMSSRDTYRRSRASPDAESYRPLSKLDVQSRITLCYALIAPPLPPLSPPIQCIPVQISLHKEINQYSTYLVIILQIPM